MKIKHALILALLALCPLPLALSTAEAQGTAFTYQGQLQNNGSPANGNYDFTFALFNNSSTNTGQVGNKLTNLDVGVTNGLFISTVDFGAGVFTGTNYWLAIGVRSNGGASFTALNPLQELTPTPYAIFANTTSNVSGTVPAAQISGAVPSGSLSGTYGSAVTLSNAGNSFTGAFTGNGGGLTNLSAWQLAGNTGTTNGNYLGTTDNQPLQIRVGGVQAGLITPSNGSPNIVFGPAQNVISNGTSGASILGGSNNTMGTGSPYSVIGGGSQNVMQASSTYDVIGGGQGNVMQDGANESVLGGGQGNVMQAGGAVLGGGYENMILSGANEAVLSGGFGNTINNAAEAALVGGEGNSIAANATFSFLGGGNNNQITTGAEDCVLVGGNGNKLTTFYAFLGGGEQNSIVNGQLSALVGGYGNTIQNPYYAFLGGGLNNTNSANEAFLGGGQLNNVGANANWAMLGGGYQNSATANYATVPGGSNNVASGQNSFAAGANAQAINSGAFVWADAEGTPFSSTTTNQFNVRANGGVRFVTSGAGLSVDGQPVLTNVPLAQLPAAVVTNNEPSVTLGSLTLGSSLNLSLPATIDVGGGPLLYADNHDNTFLGISGIGEEGNGSDNTGIGYEAMAFNSFGSGNTAIGMNALDDMIETCNYNIGIGYNAGETLQTGSNNIYIGNVGQASESGVIRIGTPGTQTQTFITGVINGNGSGLTNLNISLAQLPAAVVTNAETLVGLGSLFLTDSLILPSPASISSDFTPLLSADQNGNAYFGLAAGAGTGSDNIAIGDSALSANTSGSGNIALGYQAGINFNGSESGNIDIGNSGVQGESGIIRIGTPGTQTQTYVAGQLSVCSITITGGCDLAEPFPISTADRQVSEGAVVVIDDANPGQLKLTDRPYDTRVAGVVSGANGITPGLQMQQQGVLEGGRNVALTGRVYVQADASNGAIKPGDLLTTSSTPGRAMKVTNHAKAQGAILGKAMTGLKSGQGMVLALVTLQ